jgi:hypothetical protein
MRSFDFCQVIPEWESYGFPKRTMATTLSNFALRPWATLPFQA